MLTEHSVKDTFDWNTVRHGRHQHLNIQTSQPELLPVVVSACRNVTATSLLSAAQIISPVGHKSNVYLSQHWCSRFNPAQFNTVDSPKFLKLNLGINRGNRIMMLFHRKGERNPPRLTNKQRPDCQSNREAGRKPSKETETEDTVQRTEDVCVLVNWFYSECFQRIYQIKVS